MINNIHIPFWMCIIAELEDSPKNPTAIIKQYSISSAHAYGAIVKLAEIGLLHKQKQRRITMYSLTKKGKAISKECKMVVDYFKQNKYKLHKYDHTHSKKILVNTLPTL